VAAKEIEPPHLTVENHTISARKIIAMKMKNDALFFIFSSFFLILLRVSRGNPPQSLSQRTLRERR
jgi:hypothetical protein